MADGFETGETTGDAELDWVMLGIPRLNTMEMPLNAEFKHKGDIIPLYGQLDTAKSDLTAFKEYKTGQLPWSKSMVDQNQQITFYATMIYCITKKYRQILS